MSMQSSHTDCRLHNSSYYWQSDLSWNYIFFSVIDSFPIDCAVLTSPPRTPQLKLPILINTHQAVVLNVRVECSYALLQVAPSSEG